MATQAVLRQRVLDQLYSAQPQSRPQRLRVNGAHNSSADPVAVDDATGVSVGDLLESEAGEQLYVYDVSSNNLSVDRGENGTTAATIGDNERLYINPVWSQKLVDDAIDATLKDLSSQGIYRIKGGNAITLVAGQDEYEIVATDIRPEKGVLSLFYEEPVTGAIEAVPFQNVWDAGNQIHATGAGMAVHVIDWGRQAAGDTLEVIYAADLTVEVDTDDEPLLEDLIVQGSVAYVLMASEGPRIHDPGRYTDRTVQPGQTIRDAGSFRATYQRNAWRYKAHLRNKERNLPGGRWRRARRFRRF